VSLAGATRLSVNAAFARLGVDLGIDRVARVARAMGIASPVPSDEPQLSLGGGDLGVTTWDLAAAYATLANGGTSIPATVIDRIEDGDGEVVWRPDHTARRALAPDVAYVTAGVLQGAVEGGTGLAARVPGWAVAGKTGTTSDHADAWFVGTTPTLSAAVWLGRLEGAVPLRDVQGVAAVTGGTIPAEIFADLVAAALAGDEPVPFTLEDGAWVDVEIDAASGLRAAPWCPGDRVRLPRILAPTETCPRPPPDRDEPTPTAATGTVAPEPPEAEPVEDEPDEQEPAETQPAEAEPAEAEPAETEQVAR
jgi:penicillin-binding protein 1A